MGRGRPASLLWWSDLGVLLCWSSCSNGRWGSGIEEVWWKEWWWWVEGVSSMEWRDLHRTAAFSSQRSGAATWDGMGWDGMRRVGWAGLGWVGLL